MNLTLVNATDNCPQGYNEMFVKEYPGTQVGCELSEEVTTPPAEDPDGDTCRIKIEQTFEVYQNSFYGRKICGLQGGEPFITVTRPNITTSECPEGTLPCSTATSPTNTVCYPSEKLESSCPITEIKFMTEKQA